MLPGTAVPPQSDPKSIQPELSISSIPKDKRPVDIASDFLSALHREALSTMKKTYPQEFSRKIGQEIPVRYYLTVPAVSCTHCKIS